MSFVTIQGHDGRSVAFDRHHHAVLHRWPAVFEMKVQDDGFTFRAFGTRDYLRVLPGAADEAPVGVGEAQSDGWLFHIVPREGGFFCIQAAGGFLAAGDGEEPPLVLASDASQATLFRIDIAAGDGDQAVVNEFAGLCHAPHEKWWKATHELIVKIGIEQMLYDRRQYGFAKTFFDKLWSSQNFRDNLYLGLEEADKGDYARGYWAWHFYQPYERTSYSPGYPHARAVGTYYATRAMRVAGVLLKPGDHSAALYARCGFDLGLALHFLTDLTQPMHAANFTNASYPNWRHQAFEKFVDEARDTILKDAPPPSDADMRNLERAIGDGKYSVSGHLHSTAIESYEVWKNHLEDFAISDEVFSLEEPPVKKTVELSTALAPRRVALFVFGFVGLAERGETLVDTSTWYRIREHTKAELMSWVVELIVFQKVRRYKEGLGDHRHDFCFVPDGRGTYRIVGRHDPNWAWMLASDGGSDKFLMTMNAGEDARYNAFSVELAGVVDGRTRVQIVEPTKLELVSVSPWTTDFGGRGMRWRRSDVETDYLREQTYVLEPVGTMSAEERPRIAKIWADKIKA